MNKDLFAQQKMEIIAALFGEALSENEKEFFENNSDSSMKQFAAVSDNIVIKDRLISKDKI